MNKTKFKVIYTTSKTAFFSKLIRWLSKRKHETYPDEMIQSQMSYVFHGNIIVDSAIFKGVRCESFHKFLKSNIIINEVEYEVENVVELLYKILTTERDTMYDLLPFDLLIEKLGEEYGTK